MSSIGLEAGVSCDHCDNKAIVTDVNDDNFCLRCLIIMQVGPVDQMSPMTVASIEHLVLITEATK